MSITTMVGQSQVVKKRRSGARNADHKFAAWLHKSKITVDSPFVSDWIEEALERCRVSDDAGMMILAERLGVTKRSLIDAKNRRVRPVVHFVERLADILGYSNELNTLLPLPGSDDWGPDGTRYCGQDHEELKGCGTYFHPHHDGGLCQECWDGREDPDFVPRDRRLAKLPA